MIRIATGISLGFIVFVVLLALWLVFEALVQYTIPEEIWDALDEMEADSDD